MRYLILVLVAVVFLVGCGDKDKESGTNFNMRGWTPIVEPVIVEESQPDDKEVSAVNPEQPQEPVEEVEEEPVVTIPTEPEDDAIVIIEEPEPVVEEAENFATLSWDAPLTRENGDTLHLYEIEHYLITHTWEDTVNEVKVDYMADTYTFNDLPAGVHEFVIRTVDIDNLVSRESESVSKTIL